MNKLVLSGIFCALVLAGTPVVAAECVGDRAAHACLNDPNHDGTPNALDVGARTEHGGAGFRGAMFGSPTNGHGFASAGAGGAPGMLGIEVGAGDRDTNGDGVPDVGGANAHGHGGNRMGHGGAGAGVMLVNTDRDSGADLLVLHAGTSETGRAQAFVPLP